MTGPRARNAPTSDVVFTVRTLEQARILADPLRVRLLREFVPEPRTTKQVAERLQEKAPKLYRHVQALLDAGLLKRMGERKKRGTIERYLQAVAARFEVDRTLFDAPAAQRAKGGGAVSDLEQLIRTLFAQTQDELLKSCTPGASVAAPPTVARMYVRGSKAHVARIQHRIMALLAASQGRSRKSSAKDEVELSGLIAFHMTNTNKT